MNGILDAPRDGVGCGLGLGQVEAGEVDVEGVPADGCEGNARKGELVGCVDFDKEWAVGTGFCGVEADDGAEVADGCLG